jgi:hypothetical protein
MSQFEPEGPRGGQFGEGGPEVPGNFDNTEPYGPKPPAPAQDEDQKYSFTDEHGSPVYHYTDGDGTQHSVTYMDRGDGTWRIYEAWRLDGIDGEVRYYFADPPYDEWNKGQLTGIDKIYTNVDPNDPNPPPRVSER